VSALASNPLVPPDPRHALTPSGNLRRRQLVSRMMLLGTLLAAALAVVVLGILLVYVAIKGISAISWSFLTSSLPGADGNAGGIGPALVGSLELALIATIIALPLGVLTALALNEFAGVKLGKALQVALELMAGLPPILLGVFIFKLIVVNWQQSAIAGGITMALLEMPLIAATTLQALRAFPRSLREAADALGVARWRTIVQVVLPTCAGAILTATILATARAVGDAALVLFTSGTAQYGGQGITLDPLHSVPNLPLTILNLDETQTPALVSKAWGAAFILILIILVANIGARIWLRRSQRKRGL
jgi:phosphate transport system permease protein